MTPEERQEVAQKWDRLRAKHAAAVVAAVEAERSRVAQMARDMAEGWRESHCEHCIEGATALSNFAFELDRLPRARIEQERDSGA